MDISRRIFLKGMAASMALPLLPFSGRTWAETVSGPVVSTPKGKVQA